MEPAWYPRGQRTVYASRVHQDGEAVLGRLSLEKWDGLEEIALKSLFQDFPQDIRYTLRTLSRSPGFVLAAITSLALGIGANSAIFSVVNSLLLRPLPYRAPEELVEVYSSNPEGNPYAPSSYLDYLDIRSHRDLFQDTAAYMLVMSRMTRDGNAEVVLGELVSANYFNLLGVPPALGRSFLPYEDQTPGGHPVVVLSHGLWRRRFGQDPKVLGQTVVLNGLGFTVVGIAPPQLKGMLPGLSVDFWAPAMMLPILRPEQPQDLQLRQNRGFFMKARRQPGVKVATVQAGLNVVASQLSKAYPETDQNLQLTVLPTEAVHIHPRADRALVPVSGLLMGIFGLVLLIACTNVASMLLARATARRKEIAVRLALGGRRHQIVRQLLVECIMLALLGGGLGLLLATWLVRLLATFRPPLPFPLALDVAVDTRVVIFTLILALATGVLFGLAPALQASKPDLVSALKDMKLQPRRGRRFSMRELLVVTQVAVSLVLLVAAGLLVRNLSTAEATDPGFMVDHTAVVGVDIGVQGYSQGQGRGFFHQLVQNAGALPGVRSVSLTDRLPLDLATQTTRVFLDRVESTKKTENGIEIDLARVAPEYFPTLGIPLLTGRDFKWSDTEGAPGVVIVSEAAAKTLWPGQNAVGQRLRRGGSQGPLLEVIGVAGNTAVRRLGESPRSFLYVPFEQSYESAMQLVASTDGPEGALVPVLRGALKGMDKSLELFTAKTLRQHLSLALFPVRMAAGLLATFGLVGLVLSCVGIYGLMAFYVAQRTQEMGIRMALGAQPHDVLRMVLVEGMKVVAAGLVVGLGLALVLGPLVSQLLPGIGATDPLTLIGTTLLLAMVALAAILIPAQRATRVDPIVALTQL